MCQAPIGKVMDVGKDKLIVECKGKKLELKSKLVGIKTGDYVLFSSGIAMDKVDNEEAERILGE